MWQVYSVVSGRYQTMSKLESSRSPIFLCIHLHSQQDIQYAETRHIDSDMCGASHVLGYKTTSQQDAIGMPLSNECNSNGIRALAVPPSQLSSVRAPQGSVTVCLQINYHN